MLFMDTWTWKPENRDEVEKRSVDWKSPEGIKEHGFWIDLTGNQAFFLYEAYDPKVVLAANEKWTDIAEVDSVLVMEMEDVQTLMSQA